MPGYIVLLSLAPFLLWLQRPVCPQVGQYDDRGVLVIADVVGGQAYVVVNTGPWQRQNEPC